MREHPVKPHVFSNNMWSRDMTKVRTRARRRTRARSDTKRRGRTPPRRWSKQVTERSNALDLQRGVFLQNDPDTIAASLKRSAERSKRRKADPYRSALSML